MSAFLVNAIMLLNATLGEEIGWRGVALPGLQGQNTPVRASLILGFLWATWHIPFWLLLDSFDQFGAGYLLLNFLFVLPLTFYITWFFNHGSSSILLPVAFHVSFNIINTVLFPVTIHIGAFGIFVALEWVMAFVILPFLGTETVRVAVVQSQ
jgi:membrane protease YdiL (CAAX protease family)